MYRPGGQGAGVLPVTWPNICYVVPIELYALQVLTGMFSRTTGHIDDRWQAFMKFQIARARQYFADAEAGVDHLDADARWPVWSALILYRYVQPRQGI